MPGNPRPPLIGEVINNNRWFFSIRNAQAFGRSAGIAGAIGVLGHVQLFNPTSSGIFIYPFFISSKNDNLTTAEGYNLFFHNTALTTLVGTGFNLDNGNTASIGEIRTQTDAAGLGANHLISRNQPIADSCDLVYYRYFTRLGPGEGILVRNSTVNTFNQTSYAWIETAE